MKNIIKLTILFILFIGCNGKIKKEDSIVFIYLIAIVIKNGMNILGVSIPEKM